MGCPRTGVRWCVYLDLPWYGGIGVYATGTAGDLTAHLVMFAAKSKSEASDSVTSSADDGAFDDDATRFCPREQPADFRHATLNLATLRTHF